jgi:uncharacterized protein (DUF1800 family)
MTASRAVTRFGLGGRPNELAAVSDPQAWALAQLEGRPPERPVPEAASDARLIAALRGLRQREPESRRAIQQIAIAEMQSALALRVSTDRPVVERLVAFWTDHLCVSATAKILVAPLAGRYEREVIRPHVLGRFEDMVLASARHPAMLIYLDNAQSVGPDSPAARRLARRTQRELGLNENYARELLELHTLGVDAGYTQRDVTELARLLTGWSAEGQGGQAGVPRFVFAEARHQPGRKTVLGQRYGDGVSEGVRAIRALCRHPKTAQHIATKLARHFIADEPPAEVMERIAKVFRDSEGDLREVTRAVVAQPECWDASNLKFRVPQDWLVAALRALDAPGANEQTLNVLRQMRQPLWGPPSPKGFGDLEREWADPDSLLNRAEFARTLARRMVGRNSDETALQLAGPDFQWR